MNDRNVVEAITLIIKDLKPEEISLKQLDEIIEECEKKLRR
jgi:hypothetical protein